jgi:hypothetical protein
MKRQWEEIENERKINFNNECKPMFSSLFGERKFVKQENGSLRVLLTSHPSR